MATTDTPDDDSLPTVPENHVSTRGTDGLGRLLIYDEATGSGAWIEGYTVPLTQ